MTISIKPLDNTNWYKVYDLSVSDEQKAYFYIPNVQWIGISRYEEGGTELFAIMRGEDYAGLIGGGLDEDRISGYINPLMVDARFQRQGLATEAMRTMMDYLIRKYHVPCIHINHRKENHAAARLYEKLGFPVYSETESEFCRSYTVDYGVQILSLRDNPERAEECRRFLFEHFNEFVANHPAEVLASSEPLPQGYFMLKNDLVIGWTGLHEHEAVAGRVYGWEGSIKKDEIMSEELSPWITPLVVHPDERGNRYGKMLLEHARKEAGRLGFKIVYLTTGEIGFYEKYGFREVGLTTFTWGRPTKVYEHNMILV
jgi:ribosomal protein S18 acetylase RimI-like enzyme